MSRGLGFAQHLTHHSRSEHPAPACGPRVKALLQALRDTSTSGPGAGGVGLAAVHVAAVGRLAVVVLPGGGTRGHAVGVDVGAADGAGAAGCGAGRDAGAARCRCCTRSQGGQGARMVQGESGECHGLLV